MNVEDMKNRCLEVARTGCLVPPDGRAPSDEEREVCERIVAGIAAIPVEPDQRNAQILSLRAENRTLRRAVWHTPAMPDLLDSVSLSDVLTYAEVVHRALACLSSFQCSLIEAAPPPEDCTSSDQVVSWFTGRLRGYAERDAQVAALLEELTWISKLPLRGINGGTDNCLHSGEDGAAAVHRARAAVAATKPKVQNRRP